MVNSVDNADISRYIRTSSVPGSTLAITPDRADSTQKGTRIFCFSWLAQWHKVTMIILNARSIRQHYTHPSISRSHTPLRLCHCARTS